MVLVSNNALTVWSRLTWTIVSAVVPRRVPRPLPSLNAMPSFYAVARGNNPGVYNTWTECEGQVKGFSSAKFKKFSTYQEACDFVDANCDQGVLVGDPAGSVRNHKRPAGGLLVPSGNDSKRAKRESAAGTGSSSSCPSSSSPVPGSGPDPAAGADSLSFFATDQDGFVRVFTDGACENNGRGSHRARAGIGVYWGPGHPLNVSEPVTGPRATNNVAEIQAMSKAVEQARGAGLPKLRIFSDSGFGINCATKWMGGWKRNGWLKSDGQEAKCRADLEVLDGHLVRGDVEVNFVHVRGHSGNEGNEMADRLAVQGAKQYRPPSPAAST